MGIAFLNSLEENVLSYIINKFMLSRELVMCYEPLYYNQAFLVMQYLTVVITKYEYFTGIVIV